MSDALRVSPILDWLGQQISNHPRFWITLANTESSLLGDSLEHIRIESPIYICGLARSGSTLMLELLNSFPELASHRYRDFPFVFTPYWWEKASAFNPLRRPHKRERAHGDGMMVGPDSPEAMEEMLWIAYLPHLHEARDQRWETIPTEFADFYRNHIKKLLLARKAQRYLCKNNYNITRMQALGALFADARFIIPVREPASHIASLMRQHQRFCDAGRNDMRVVRHMDTVGHFEFGLHRTPIHLGDAQRLQEIQDAWQRGEEVRGWALYWDMLYGYLHASHSPSSITVRYEDMCSAPQEVLPRVLAHCGLTADEVWLNTASTVMKPLKEPEFSAGDRQLIADITGETAQLYGYR